MYKASIVNRSFAQHFAMTSQRRIGHVQLLIIQEKFLIIQKQSQGFYLTFQAVCFMVPVPYSDN